VADFYADPACQDVFQNFLVTITSRVNTLTGITYRCAGLPALYAWPEEMERATLLALHAAPAAACSAAPQEAPRQREGHLRAADSSPYQGH
jgi:hypothetical protein